MADREKVIKGLPCLTGVPIYCETCPYSDEYGFGWGNRKCAKECASDALELLKEQEAEWIEYPECLAYDGAYSDSHIVCSACKHVFSIMDNCTEEFDYCPHCGAKMDE